MPGVSRCFMLLHVSTGHNASVRRQQTCQARRGHGGRSRANNQAANYHNHDDGDDGDDDDDDDFFSSHIIIFRFSQMCDFLPPPCFPPRFCCVIVSKCNVGQHLHGAGRRHARQIHHPGPQVRNNSNNNDSNDNSSSGSQWFCAKTIQRRRPIEHQMLLCVDRWLLRCIVCMVAIRFELVLSSMIVARHGHGARVSVRRVPIQVCASVCLCESRARERGQITQFEQTQLS